VIRRERFSNRMAAWRTVSSS